MFGLLAVLLMCDSWNPMWEQFLIEDLMTVVEEFGQRVICVVLNGAYFYEFDKVDIGRISRRAKG